MIFTAATATQRVCTIYATSLNTLTPTGWAVASGTQNVIIYCICTTDNVAVGPAIWIVNNALVTRTTADGSDNPYYRDNVPSPLIIPSFTDTHVVACTSVGTTIANTITLTLLGMLILTVSSTN